MTQATSPPAPRVSVLLPARDAERTVEAALASLLQGTLGEIEVVAVDDGSRDATHAVLEAVARRDPRVRPLRQPPMGLVAALNNALAEARAPLIARQDADDTSRPERLARQLTWLEQHPDLDGVGCAVRVVGRGSDARGLQRYAAWQNSLLEPEAIRRAALIECPVAHATLLLRRDALDRIGGWQDRGWAEDHDLVCRLLAEGARLGKLADRLYTWVDHPLRASRLSPACSPESFHRLRLAYLQRLVLPRPARVDLWGVGRLLERWRQSLTSVGHEVTVREVNPRRLKLSRGGRERIDPSRLPPLEGECLLIAYGMASVRDLVRAALGETGLEEGRDYWAVG